jgi:hypothetical protein
MITWKMSNLLQNVTGGARIQWWEPLINNYRTQLFLFFSTTGNIVLLFPRIQARHGLLCKISDPQVDVWCHGQNLRNSRLKLLIGSDAELISEVLAINPKWIEKYMVPREWIRGCSYYISRIMSQHWLMGLLVMERAKCAVAWTLSLREVAQKCSLLKKWVTHFIVWTPLSSSSVPRLNFPWVSAFIWI